MGCLDSVRSAQDECAPVCAQLPRPGKAATLAVGLMCIDFFVAGDDLTSTFPLSLKQTDPGVFLEKRVLLLFKVLAHGGE